MTPICVFVCHSYPHNIVRLLSENYLNFFQRGTRENNTSLTLGTILTQTLCKTLYLFLLDYMLKNYHIKTVYLFQSNFWNYEETQRQSSMPKVTCWLGQSEYSSLITFYIELAKISFLVKPSILKFTDRELIKWQLWLLFDSVRNSKILGIQLNWNELVTCGLNYDFSTKTKGITRMKVMILRP